MIDNIREHIDNKNRELEGMGEFKHIRIKHSIKGDKIALRYDSTDAYSNREKVEGVIDYKDSDEDVLDSIDSWVNNIIDGVKAVANINSIIKEHQKENRCPLRVIYRLGYGKEDNVRIIDWDYDKVIVKLNGKSLCNLMGYVNNVEDIVCLADYEESIDKFIGEFNSLKLHKVIGATVDEDTMYVLKENMLDRDDVIRTIRESSGSKGVQRIKSVFSIPELYILAIFIWEVDFDLGIVNTVLLDGKMLNVKDNVYVRDKSICSAIQGLYGIKAREIYDLF